MLASVDAATTRVDIRPGYASTLTISSREMDRAACRAKWLVYGSTGAVFLTGALLGALVAAAAF
jgi:hypothetical protein